MLNFFKKKAFFFNPYIGVLENKKIDAIAASYNVLLSIVGIGESGEPHNLAKSHDKYAYGDL